MKQSYTLALLLLGLLAALSTSAQITYVKSDATGANTGASWADAYTNLDLALTNANPGAQLWVAAGTYKPSQAAPNNYFLVESGVSLYGGFAGTETALEQRNYLTNATILSGDIAGDDIAGDFAQKRTDNARHVLYVLNGDPLNRTVVDGFTIKGGNSLSATADPDLTKRGGGILAAAKLTARNCTFADNFAPSGAGIAAIAAAGSGLIVDNCIFDGNLATEQSAGVYLRQLTSGEINRSIFRNNTTNRGCVYPQSCTSIVIDSCLFESNKAGTDQFGAALFTWQTNFTLSNSVIRKNTATNAAGMYNDGRENISSFLIDNCVFDSNTTSGYGGTCMYNWIGNFEVKNSTFSNNYAPNTGSAMYNARCKANIHDSRFENGQSGMAGGAGFGGAIANYSAGSDVTITDCTFEGNKAARSGGAVTVGFTAKVALKNCTFNANTAQYGGAVFCQNDTTSLSVEGCTFSENGAENTGGALNISSGIVTNIKNSVFFANGASTGGAIDISEDSLDLAVLNVENTIFRDNICTTQAAAINQNNADVNLKNCLFSFNLNIGDGAGGAISSNASGKKTARVNAVNCTFASNVSQIGAGIAQFEVDTSDAILTLQNCILFNEGDNYAVEAGEPEVVSAGGNVVSDATLNDFLLAGQDVPETDPFFVDGPSYDFHLLLNSPAIDRGVAAGAPPTDIEGNPRINEPDAGAYENQEVLGLNDLARALPLQLTPNPAIDFTQLGASGTWNGAVRIEVTAVGGKLVRTVETEKTTADWQYRLDVKNLPAGVYFVKARLGGALYVGKLVKE